MSQPDTQTNPQVTAPGMSESQQHLAFARPRLTRGTLWRETKSSYFSLAKAAPDLHELAKYESTKPRTGSCSSLWRGIIDVCLPSSRVHLLFSSRLFRQNLWIYRERSVKASKVLRKCKCCSLSPCSPKRSVPDRAQEFADVDACQEGGPPYRPVSEASNTKNKNEWFTARHLHNVSASRRGNYKSSLALLLRGVYLLWGCTRLCNFDAEWGWKQRWIKTSSIRTYHYPQQGRNFQCSSDEERLGTPTVRSDRWKPERSLRSNLEFLACLMLS